MVVGSCSVFSGRTCRFVQTFWEAGDSVLKTPLKRSHPESKFLGIHLYQNHPRCARTFMHIKMFVKNITQLEN